MTTWRDRMQPASFRGVPFSIKGARREIGRRTVLHELPVRDDPGGEDMGRRTRRYSIDALIVGGDYFAARDKLIDALEVKGPGELVHPFYGRKWVRLDGPVSISESLDEGGKATFSLEFVEAGIPSQPTTQADTQATLKNAADDARAASGAAFASKYSITGKPAFVASSALTMAKAAMDKMANLRAAIPDLSAAAAWVATAQAVSGQLTELIAAPVSFVSNVQALISGVLSLADNPLDAFKSLSGLFGFGKSDAVDYSYSDSTSSASAAATAAIDSTATPARAQVNDNADAIASLIQSSAVIEACAASAEITWSSLDDAVTMQTTLVDQIDTLIEASTDDDMLSSLFALRVAVVQDVMTRGALLPRLSTVTLPATLPAVVVAYQIYNDATRDSDIIDRNPAIAHPGFVPGGVSLEILADA